MRLNIEVIKPRETDLLLDALGRMGFEVGEADGDDVSATRPDVLNLHEFKMAARSADSPLYAGVVWGRLQALGSGRFEGDSPVQSPIRFMRGSWSPCYITAPNLLVTSTLPPTVDWLEENWRELYHGYRVNPRMINVARRVSEVIAIRNE